MPNSSEHNITIEDILKNAGLLKQRSEGLSDTISELRKSSIEVVNSRRAAFNLLEDAFLSKAALHKSEQRLELALKAAKMGTFIYYVQQDRTDSDNQMLVLFGLGAGEPLNLKRALTELIHPDDRQRYADDVTNAVNDWNSGKLNSDIRVIHPDGSVHWLNVTAQVSFEGEERRAVTMSGVCLDISERKNAEEALRTSEERLRITTESAVDFAIINTNTKGIIEGWSKGAEYTFGYTPDEVRGKPAHIIFTPEDRQHHVPEKEMQTARENGFAPDERWHLKKDGSRFYASGVMRPLYNNNKLKGYVKVARDMTNPQQAQEQLKLLEERNRIALQSAEMASWDWDIPNDITIWNAQHYLLFGLEPETEGKKSAFFLQFIYPDDKEMITAKLKDAVEVSGIYKAEFRIVRADNKEVRWMTGFGRAIEWESAKVKRMVGVMFDTTDRKKLEQQKEEFLGIASHELKTPVTSLMAYGDLLEETIKETGNNSKVELIQKMNAQISRLNMLITDLLDTTKISEGQLLLNYEAFDIVGLIQQLAGELQQLSQKHKLIVQCTTTIIVNADRKRIEQVITNLISNALKYSPDGGDVIVDCKTGKTGVKVSISDDGIGIPKDMQNKIFTRFFRVLIPQLSKQPGMGLGLYISAGIIQRHGGTIGVENNKKKGSVFYFTLPYKPK